MKKKNVFLKAGIKVFVMVFICILTISSIVYIKNAKVDKYSQMNNFENEDTSFAQTTQPQTKENINQTQQTTTQAKQKQYDYAAPVKKSEKVGVDYFNDAVFIGDSRTEGFILYNGLNNTKAFTGKGIMADSVFTSPVITFDGKKMSIMSAVKRVKFSKVYIMLGINEMGWPSANHFIDKYGNIIDEIRKINPNAKIYVQSILPVSESVSSTHKYITNSKINDYNKQLQKMAKDKQVYYLNVKSALESSAGDLPLSATYDGIHLKKEYCQKWLNYLLTHTVK